jgi:UDP-N-acetylglucosamine 2-epimerase (non-hydrolysing)
MTKKILSIYGTRPDAFKMNPHVRALAGCDQAIDAEKSDLILVHDDTSIALSAALDAFHCPIRVGHIKAGLRTGDPGQPCPEEMSRRIVNVIRDFLFVPPLRFALNLADKSLPDATLASA